LSGEFGKDVEGGRQWLAAVCVSGCHLLLNHSFTVQEWLFSLDSDTSSFIYRRRWMGRLGLSRLVLD
jgi:hypothetical protein